MTARQAAFSVAALLMLLCSVTVAVPKSDAEPLLRRHVLTLKDFWDDSTLYADPRNLVAVTFRDTPEWVPIPSEFIAHSAWLVGTVPYYIDRSASLRFRWPLPDNADDVKTYAVLLSMDRAVLLVLQPGGSETVHLAPGRYTLLLFRDVEGMRAPVFLQPEPDITEPLFDPETTPYPQGLVLRSAECSGCNISGGNFFQASLAFTALNGGTLSGANLFQADLTSCSLAGMNMDGANLFQAVLPGAVLKGTRLEGANVFQADFSSAVLANASMKGINAPEANFSQADLRSVDISGAVLGYINAENANFSGANLKGTILEYALLGGASFSGCNLSEADLTGADVQGTDFSGADMTNATWVNGERCMGSSVATCP